MGNYYFTYGSAGLVAAVVCAKWAAELGFGQARQLIWGVGGLLAPPVILLILYVRLLRRYKTEGHPAGRW
ncbi:MAG: hypothetical protein ACE5I3_06480 [Phycisphaerae bacterium]